jgi:histidinol-phosphatase (PHP family)
MMKSLEGGIFTMSQKIKFDLHTHHNRCGHAEGNIEDYIKAAIQNDLQVIGISDHTPFFYSEEDQLYPGIAMPKSGFPNYIEEVQSLKEKYKGKIQVLLGVESDFFPKHINVYRQILNKYPFDYIIGSVHYVQDISIFKKGRWEGLTSEQQVQVKEDYYHIIEQSVHSNLFQIIAHMDAMKGFYPAFSAIETDVVENTLKIIGEQDLAIEVNTSGNTKDCGGWYPADDILERALFYNVKITFGSDAHVPERVGDEWELVRTRLKEIGFRDWVYFVNKQRVSIPI